ncbi:hypothetical protein QR680_003468 [Steinernema hermaphroditum]|uniref:RRM domain-containing protein n=1 Tax=Steinernema hermaphroditum TaxID=289476 RepID=A0AA39H6X7_9BILA|nr:hypothetical protein QR680_003468 [Steinernema hermaphroditum]
MVGKPFTRLSEALESVGYTQFEDDFADNSFTTPKSLQQRKIQRANRKLHRTCEDRELENKRTVFVGNVFRELTKRDLHNIFGKAGKIEKIRLRGVFPGKQTLGKRIAVITHQLNEKIPTQFYYIRYSQEEEARIAVDTLNGQVVKNYPLRVDLCSEKPNYSSNLSVFVGNLPFEVKEEEVRQHFEAQGILPVDYVRIVRDTGTGLGKGFGFVCFKDRSMAKDALKLNETKLAGRKIRVMRTSDEGNSKRAQKYKLDPDSNVIPIITSVGDLMSSLLFNLLLRATGVGSQPTTHFGVTVAPVVDMNKNPFDKFKCTYFLLQSFCDVVCNSKWQMLVQHNMQLDNGLCSSMVYHNVIKTFDLIVVFDCNSQYPADVLLLGTTTNHQWNVVHCVIEPRECDERAGTRPFDISQNMYPYQTRIAPSGSA